jgi:hypothetical protein
VDDHHSVALVDGLLPRRLYDDRISRSTRPVCPLRKASVTEFMLAPDPLMIFALLADGPGCSGCLYWHSYWCNAAVGHAGRADGFSCALTLLSRGPHSP